MGPASRTTFGDLCLEDWGIVVESILDDPPAARIETEEVPGSDGVEVLGVTREQMEITLECRAFTRDWHSFDELKDMLGSLIGTDAELTTRSHPGGRYHAYLTEVQTGDRLNGIGAITLTFVVPGSVRVGDETTVAVPSGGEATFEVTGTVAPHLVITCPNAVRDPSSNVWGLTFDDSAVVQVRIPTSAASSVSIDCADRVVKVAGATSMITLSSDWPKLSRGTHTVRMSQGTGDATITMTERWL